MTEFPQTTTNTITQFKSTTFQDHWNWPAPQRKDLMGLSTIQRQDNTGFPKIRFERNSSSLNTKDISGASPILKGYQYQNKESFINKCDDIVGERMLQKEQRKCYESYSLKNEDIEGTKPRISQFKTNRVSNPLEPEYILPSYIQTQPPIPKFVRDTMNISDIDGTKPCRDIWTNYVRNTNPYTEIEGAKAKPKFIPKDTIDKLQVKEINNDGKFKTNRITNILDPRYRVQDDEGSVIPDYGFVKGSISKIKHPDLNKEKSFNLNTKDIVGGHANSLNEKRYFMEQRRSEKLSQQTQDIPGAQTGTLKKGLKTNRVTDPNRPAYLVPGHSQPTDVYGNRTKAQLMDKYVKK